MCNAKRFPQRAVRRPVKSARGWLGVGPGTHAGDTKTVGEESGGREEPLEMPGLGREVGRGTAIETGGRPGGQRGMWVARDEERQRERRPSRRSSRAGKKPLAASGCFRRGTRWAGWWCGEVAVSTCGIMRRYRQISPSHWQLVGREETVRRESHGQGEAQSAKGRRTTWKGERGLAVM